MFKDNTGVDFVEIIKSLRTLTSESEILQTEQLECHHNRVYSSLPQLMANDNVNIDNKLGFLDYTNLKFTNKGEIALI